MKYASAFAPGLMAGKVVVVTGGGSGIGRCTAHELAALGAHAVLIGRKAGKLQAVQQEIAQDGGSSSCHVCDIRQEEAVRQTVAAVVAAHGHIDGLVNNAGGQYITPLESMSTKGWQAVIDTNLTGGFLMARECYVQAMRHTGGSIVNIVADIWGSMPGMGHSGAARADMVSFTETAALEWAHSGVRVNAVAPGYIAFGNEAETSAGIVFLLSPAASFISGSTMRIDGARPQARLGWPIQRPDPAAPVPDAVRPFGGFHRATVPKIFST